MGGLNVQVVQSTSDEAKGILAHVREELGAHHSPDLFHLQQDLVRGVFPSLCRKLKQARKELKAVTKTMISSEKIITDQGGTSESRNCQRYLEDARQNEADAIQVVEKLEALRVQAKEDLVGISTAYHPYDLSSGAERSVESRRKKSEGVWIDCVVSLRTWIWGNTL